MNRDFETYLDQAAKSAQPAESREQGRTHAQAIANKIFSDLKPVHPLPPVPFLLLFCLIPALIVVASGEKIFGLAGWEAQSWMLRGLLFGAGGVALLTASYSFSLHIVPGARRRFSTLAVQLVAAVLFIGTAGIAFHQKYAIDIIAADKHCFKNGLIIAAITLALTLLATKRGVWLDRLASSLQLAALASSAALLVLTLYCPVLAASHVFVAHFGAVGVTLLVAWLVGRLLR
jgi:hypothetical protein